MEMGQLDDLDFMGAEYPADFVGPLLPGDTRPLQTTPSSGVTPADVKSWTDVLTGAATSGAQAYRTVVDTVTGKTVTVPVQTTRKDNTMLYLAVGLGALFLLGGGTYMLVGKGRKKGR